MENITNTAPSRHRNRLSRAAFVLSPKVFGGSAEQGTNWLDVIEKVAESLDDDPIRLMNPRGSTVYARRNGELLWEIIGDIDVCCYFSSSMIGRLGGEEPCQLPAALLAKALIERGLRIEVRRSVPVLISRTGRAYPVTTGCLSIERLHSVPPTRYAYLWGYQPIENYFGTPAGEARMLEIVARIPPHDTWSVTEDLVARLLRRGIQALSTRRVLLAALQPGRSGHHRRRTLRCAAMIAYLRGNEEMLEAILKEMQASEGPFRGRLEFFLKVLSARRSVRDLLQASCRNPDTTKLA